MTEHQAQTCADDLRAQRPQSATVLRVGHTAGGWAVLIEDPLLTTIIAAYTRREAEFVVACLDLLAALAER